MILVLAGINTTLSSTPWGESLQHEPVREGGAPRASQDLKVQPQQTLWVFTNKCKAGLDLHQVLLCSLSANPGGPSSPTGSFGLSDHSLWPPPKWTTSLLKLTLPCYFSWKPPEQGLRRWLSQQSTSCTIKNTEIQVLGIPRDVRQPNCMPRCLGHNQGIPGTYSPTE